MTEQELKDNVLSTVMSVDGANKIILEELMSLEYTDKVKLEEAKKLIEEGYSLILNSIS